MLNLTEYRGRPTRLADYLPWGLLVAEGIVLNKDGSFMRVCRLRGPDLETATAAELQALMARMNAVLRRLDAGWMVQMEARRRPALDYPVSNFPDPVSRLVDAERRARFLEHGQSFESECHLTLTWLPPVEASTRAEGLLFERADKVPAVDYRHQLERFLMDSTRVFDALAALTLELEVLDSGAALTYLHGTISPRDHAVAVPEVPCYLDAVLADSPLLGGLRPKLGNEHLAIVGILGFPDVTRPGLLDGLNDLHCSYRWTTRFISLDKTRAEKILNRYRRQWFAKRKGLVSIVKEVMTNEPTVLVDTDADNKAADVTAALEELGGDLVSFGYVTTTVVLSDPDPNTLADKMRAVERVLNGAGLVTIRESVNAVEAWLGSLPGQAYANIRMPLMHSLNLAHMLPVGQPWAGPKCNAHLDAPVLLMARTRGSTPFRLDLHVGDVGHSFVVGPTGAGKSVLLSLLVLQFRRYAGARVFAFDKGRSLRAVMLAMGGTHWDAGQGYQPLRHIHDDDTRSWALQWVLGLIGDEGVTLTPEHRAQVWAALRNLSAAPEAQRTLSGIAMLLPDSRLRQALKPYLIDSALGVLLDADHDALDLGDLQVFEMESIMERKAAVAPVLSYLFHRLESRFDGRPTLLILDEAWAFLDHPLFEAKLKDWLKTLRKKNVAVVFATQSLSDIAASPIAPTLIESCPTRIFLPNDRAREPATRKVYESFGLNDREIALLSEAIPKRDYYLQSARGCRLFSLDLGPLALALTTASTPADQKLIDGLLHTHGVGNFAAAFFRAKGLGWAADIITKGV